MKRITNFGSFTIDQQLEVLENKLEKGDILLFQYYESNSEYLKEQDRINEYFENYCDDVIYYYNPDLQVTINKSVIHELIKNMEAAGETDEERKMEGAIKLFDQMKAGNCTGIYDDVLVNIKKIVYDKLINCNRDNLGYEYVLERMYGKSRWILDERGIVSDTDGAIWYKPLNRDEYYNVLKSFSLFSCIVLKEGEDVDKFSVGYVVEETADNYDLLIFKNG